MTILDSNGSVVGLKELGRCPGDGGDIDENTLSVMENLLNMSYVCRDGWFLTPPCAAFGNSWWHWFV